MEMKERKEYRKSEKRIDGKEDCGGDFS